MLGFIERVYKEIWSLESLYSGQIPLSTLLIKLNIRYWTSLCVFCYGGV